MAQSGQSDKRPNILVVCVDQWGGGLLGCAGHPIVQTPTLNQLARNGVRFNRAYTECPICIPARRTLMTGTETRTHGDRVFGTTTPMPDLPTMAQTFRDAGYQAYAVGKLHVFPGRDRIGFDDVLLSEEGRPHLSGVDDHDLYLADRGFAGQGFTHGMNNNNYMYRPWHLPEDCHVTNWATMQMARTIKRRDPTRPSFWYLSYTPPHPPIVPLASYMDIYSRLPIPPALDAPWSANEQALPRTLRMMRNFWPILPPEILTEVRRAFYALCTHIDHQLRVIIGTLREEDELDNTVILFTSDHGDMLGDFGFFAKRLYYEPSAQIPMIVVGRPGDSRIEPGSVDDRLVGLQDVMPTLLELAGIEVPSTVEGRSMLTGARRSTLYGDCLDSHAATRMLHDGRHKLIWYPAGNRVHLFDLEADPKELNDVSAHPDYAETRKRLEQALAAELWGIDVEQGWAADGRLKGYEVPPYEPVPDRSLSGQRGLHYPQPPVVAQDKVVGFPQ